MIRNEIVVVVVTYNRKQLLIENLQKLLEQTYSRFDIFIVDNHSTDDTYDYIEELLLNERIFYYDTGSNLGGAGGFQYGIKHAVNEGYKYSWIMDDDSMPTPTALENLVEIFKASNSDIGFLSSKVLWTDGTICNMNIQRLSATKKVTDFSKPLIPIAVASFVSMFVSADVVKDVGLPFKEFFIWTDDWEYTRRISKKYPCYLSTESVVVHKTESNVGSNIALDTESRLPRYEYAYRNEMYFYRREGIKGMAYYFAKLLLHTYRIVRFSKDNRIKRLKIMYKSALKGLFFDPDIEYVS